MDVLTLQSVLIIDMIVCKAKMTQASKLKLTRRCDV